MSQELISCQYKEVPVTLGKLLQQWWFYVPHSLLFFIFTYIVKHYNIKHTKTCSSRFGGNHLASSLWSSSEIIISNLRLTQNLKFYPTLEVGKVYISPGLSILLLLDYHSPATRVWFAGQHPLLDPLHHVRLNIRLHLDSEVQRQHRWLIAAIGDGVWLCVDLHWFVCCNRLYLSSARVESRLFEIVLYPFLQCWYVAPRCWH